MQGRQRPGIENGIWQRDLAERRRPAVRAWAEKFDWKLIAADYQAAYRDVLARG